MTMTLQRRLGDLLFETSLHTDTSPDLQARINAALMDLARAEIEAGVKTVTAEAAAAHDDLAKDHKDALSLLRRCARWVNVDPRREAGSGNLLMNDLTRFLARVSTPGTDVIEDAAPEPVTTCKTLVGNTQFGTGVKHSTVVAAAAEEWRRRHGVIEDAAPADRNELVPTTANFAIAEVYTGTYLQGYKSTEEAREKVHELIEEAAGDRTYNYRLLRVLAEWNSEDLLPGE